VSDRLTHLRADADPVDVDVVLIAFAGPDALDDYQHRRDLSFPILVDAERLTYAAYGLGRGSFAAVWGFATIKKYVSLLLSRNSPIGRRDLGAATEDTRQLGGDFVIGPDGRLAWGYWCTGPADRPSADEVVAAVRTASDVR
jgi:peroxiredoxin